MSQPTIEAYGFELALVNKPSNLQDFIDAFGADKAFEYADRYRTYHIIANGARDFVLDAIEKVTGIKPRTKKVPGKPKADGTPGDEIEVQDEADSKYVARAQAEAARARVASGEFSDEEKASEAVRALLTSELSNAVVDYSKEPERRQGGPKKPGVQVTKRAQAIKDKGAETTSKTIAGLRAYLPESSYPTPVPADDSVESIAMWLLAFDKHEEAEKAKKEKQLADLGS